MRFQIFASLAIFGLALFGFFSHNNPEITDQTTAPLEQGRVLGVSEAGSVAVDDFPDKQQLSEFVLPDGIKIQKQAHLINDSAEPEIKAAAGIAIDTASGQILAAKDETEKRSIASLTKLFTALTVLDQNLDWEAYYAIQSADCRDGGLEFVFPGNQVKNSDLLRLSLSASDNTATVALASSAGWDEAKFAAKMNDKAKELGLAATSFADITGLSDRNQSSAADLAKIISMALAKPEIKAAVLAGDFEFSALGKPARKVRTTNKLLAVYPREGIDFEGGKTGFTNSAGYCFAGQFSQTGMNSIVTVVLGGDSPESRFDITEELASWVYGNYEWR